MRWMQLVEFDPPPKEPKWMELVRVPQTATGYPVVSIVSGRYGVARTWAHRTQCSQCKRCVVSPKADQAMTVYENWLKIFPCDEVGCPVIRDRSVRRKKRG